MAKQKAGKGELGVVGFILGMLSIIFVASNGVILAILGFIFSYVQQKRDPTKLGKLGKILSIIGFVLALILVLFVYLFQDVLVQQIAGQFPTA